MRHRLNSIAQKAISTLIQQIPFSMGLAGKKQHYIMGIIDYLQLYNRKIESLSVRSKESLFLDLGKRNERLVYYCYRNIKSFFQKEGLFHAMQNIPEIDRKVFLDVGANLGIWSIIAGELGFTPVCVEPDPSSLAFLKRNRHIFWHILPIAFSNTNGKLPFYKNEYNPGNNSLVRKHTSKVEATEYVNVCKLDDYFYKKSILLDTCIIKIDVEGNELSTIEGMKSFLKLTGYPSIWIEVRGVDNSGNPGTDIQVIDLMFSLGYLAMIFDGAKFVEYNQFKHQKTLYDIFFVKKETR